MKVEEVKKAKSKITTRWGKGPDGTSAKIRKLVEEKKDEVFSYDDLIALTGKEPRNLTSILQYLVRKGEVGRIYVDDHPYFGDVKTVEKLLGEKVKQKEK